MPERAISPRVPSSARHYASALLDLAEQEQTYDGWSRRLERLLALVQGTELGAALASPQYSGAQRRQLADAVLAREPEIDRPAVNLMRLLIASRRTALLPAIAQAYLELMERRQGKLRARLVTAVPLDAEELERFSSELSARLGRTVAFRAEVDPDLLGGAVVRVGDRVFDASLRTRLQQLRQKMLTEAGAS